MSSSDNNQTETRVVGVDEKIGVGTSFFLGFQSILACNLFLGPIVIIAALSFNITQAAALITLTFFACGIGTIIQSGLFLKFPIIQGVSFAALGGIIAISTKSDFATCFGSILISSLIIVVLGYFKIISKLVKKFIPTWVAGTVILVIGISLMFTTFNSVLGLPGNQNINFLEAGFTYVLLFVLIQLSKIPNKFGTIIRIGSVIYALVIGTIFASFFGHVDLSAVADAPWIALPDFFAFGAPKFDVNVILVFTFILIIVLIESIGTWFSVTAISGEEITDRQIDRGVMGEGFACAIGALFCGAPVTGYGSNTGVLVVTRNLSRYAAIAGGVISLVVAFCPKLMYVIACIPSSVVWGTYGIISTLIAVSAAQSLKASFGFERRAFIVLTTIFVTVCVSLMPAALVNSMPTLLSYLFGSAICIGALAVIVLNLVLPKSKEEREQPHL